jgi:hypothetical protein
MRASLSDYKFWAQASRHFFGNGNDVVPAGAGIACRATEIVYRTRTAKIQLHELGAISIPLENDRFSPVMPKRSSDNQVLVDKDVRAVTIFVALSAGRLHIVGIHCRKTIAAFVPINLAVFGRQMNVGGFIIRFMDY